MDDIVQQAMAKWPNVPAVYGWLSLSRRGEWRIKGERISNPIVIDFINRNYMHDEHGRWFFQNGPQRVYVSLDYTPLVYRFADTENIVSHTGRDVIKFDYAYLDDEGSLLLSSEMGIGVVDDRDLDKCFALLVDELGKQLTSIKLEKFSALQPQDWSGLFLNVAGKTLSIQTVRVADIPARFAFNANPRQAEGEEECY
jgi:Protein of unknown function (DUF2946)